MESAGAPIFGVATTEEGIELRLNGITAPILVFGGTYPQEIERVLANRLTPVIYDLEVARAFQAWAAKEKKRLSVHLKIDTGLNRLGDFLAPLGIGLEGSGGPEKPQSGRSPVPFLRCRGGRA